MEYELYHHGVLGMKWGVRRYQNKDGSLTSAGKRRYGSKENYEYGKREYATAYKYNKAYESGMRGAKRAILANTVGKSKTLERLEVKRATNADKALKRDVDSFEQYRNTGIKNKKGKVIYSSKDVKDTIRGLNEVRLNSLSKVDHYSSGRDATEKLMKDLSVDYKLVYNVSTGRYSLEDKG